jgi:hemoglobin
MVGGIKDSDTETPYESLGGAHGVQVLVKRFYEIMDHQSQFSEIRALHGADLSRPRQDLFEFLSGWLGGPPLYFEKGARRCIMSAHSAISIGATEVTQWVKCMEAALSETHITQDLRERIIDALSRFAGNMQNKT